MTPSQLTQAAGACLLAALASRTRWDEDPELALLRHDHQAVTAVPLPIPARIWRTGPNRQVLAALARAITRTGLTPALAACLDTTQPRGWQPAPLKPPSPAPSRTPCSPPTPLSPRPATRPAAARPERQAPPARPGR